MINSPCKDCSDRGIGCHSKCESYSVWSKAHTREKEMIRDKKNKENLAISWKTVYWGKSGNCGRW